MSAWHLFVLTSTLHHFKTRQWPVRAPQQARQVCAVPTLENTTIKLVGSRHDERIGVRACSIASFPPFFVTLSSKLHIYIRCCNQRRNKFFLPKKATGNCKSATTVVDVGLKILRALVLSTSSHLCTMLSNAGLVTGNTPKGVSLSLKDFFVQANFFASLV